ncbi:pilus assembly protein TadG-related protein [Bordetella sp. N]|uniref:pilus assembly protein TadG-related protein n=1 Tax=Bordetella sp. N TaxID=1746199 RepID=UPI00070BACA0|nr:pilus assembly protein TadG-related protein [Bordetella sp. N]ALM83678.1 hypothetical protein ASB57_12470 [Bordetella sp. N]
MKTRARGYAIPLALGLVSVGVMALVALHDHGNTVAARVRLTHAADAAAYSGALVQARALNLLAYINRTQAAHQIALAHIATLASWAQFARNESARFRRGNPPGMLIAMFYGPTHAMAYASAVRIDGVAGALDRFAEAHARHDALVHDVLSRAAQAVLRDLPDARQRTMRTVLQANYPEWPRPALGAAIQRDRLALAFTDDHWPGFVQRYSGRRDGTFRPLVLRATDRYAFLGPRRGLAMNPWPVSYLCPTLRHQLRRMGGTSLTREGTWESVDTQSHHALRSNKYIGCYYREYAMGWGKVRNPGKQVADETAPHAPADFSRQSFWRWVQENAGWDLLNGHNNPLAHAYARLQRQRWHGRGMAAYAEVPLQRAARPAGFEIVLRQPAVLLPALQAGLQAGSQRDSQASSQPSLQPGRASGDPVIPAVHPRGRYAYAGLDADEHVTVTSAAETYFVRPQPRDDGREEIATLFRPYWQAHLVAVRGQGRQSARRPSGARRQRQRRDRCQSDCGEGFHNGSRNGIRHARRRKQRGFGLLETWLVMGLLLALAAGGALLGEWHGLGLRAAHASRAQAFHAAQGAREHAGGSPDDVDNAAAMDLFRDTALPSVASGFSMPGGAVTADLRRDWNMAHDGLLAVHAGAHAVRQGEATGAGVLRRHTALISGAGHATGDRAAQARIAGHRAAWRQAADRTRRAGRRVALALNRIDAGWGRSAPEFDWLTRWADLVPAERLRAARRTRQASWRDAYARAGE